MHAFPTTHALRDRFTPVEIRGILDASLSGAAAADPSGKPWKAAVDALVDECIARDVCFSSGEIAACLRTYRPDLRFSVQQDLGPHLRARYEAGGLPAYPSGPAIQCSRATVGYSLTPAGTTVMVYGPTSSRINAHEFEVAVPAPGGAVPDLTNLPPVPAQITHKLVQPPAAKAPKKKGKKARKKARRPVDRTSARVHADKRLCIPRWAFAALSAQAGVLIQGGDTVYVAVDASAEVRLTLAPAPGAAAYRLVASRCRLLLTGGGSAFSPGTRYKVEISAAGLRMDLTSPA